MFIKRSKLGILSFAPNQGEGSGTSEKPKTLAAAGERITTLEGELATAVQKAADAEARAEKAEADHKQAASQLEAAVEAGKTANAERDKALADLGAANTSIGTLNTEMAAVKGDLGKAKTTITHLEGLCQVKGIDHKAAAPAESGTDSSTADEAVYTKWESLSGAEKTEYFRTNKAALERYGKANADKKAA